MAHAARRAGVAIVGGDTKVVEHGKADGMYITTTGIGRPLAGLTLIARIGAPGRPGAGVRPDRRSRHHDPAGARRARPRGRPALRHPLGAAAGRGARRRGGSWRALDARSDARRRRHVAERAGARLRARHLTSRKSVPVRDAVRGRLRAARPRSAAHRQRRTVPRRRRARARGRGARRAARARPAARTPRSSAMSATQPAGTVLATTRYGATRVVDMLVGDPLPRIC